MASTVGRRGFGNHLYGLPEVISGWWSRAAARPRSTGGRRATCPKHDCLLAGCSAQICAAFGKQIAALGIAALHTLRDLAARLARHGSALAPAYGVLRPELEFFRLRQANNH